MYYYHPLFSPSKTKCFVEALLPLVAMSRRMLLSGSDNPASIKSFKLGQFPFNHILAHSITSFDLSLFKFIVLLLLWYWVIQFLKPSQLVYSSLIHFLSLCKYAADLSAPSATKMHTANVFEGIKLCVKLIFN
jgi:hypothetical protein